LNGVGELFAKTRFVLHNENPQANLRTNLSLKQPERQMNRAFIVGSADKS
jgi:hypothetical protein